METILHGQKAEDLASVCCRIDHAKGLRVVAEFRCHCRQGESFVLPWLALLDQVVIVLRELATPAPVLRQALERLGTASPHVVVNRAMQPAVDVAAALRTVRA